MSIFNFAAPVIYRYHFITQKSSKYLPSGLSALKDQRRGIDEPSWLHLIKLWPKESLEELKDYKYKLKGIMVILRARQSELGPAVAGGGVPRESLQ